MSAPERIYLPTGSLAFHHTRKDGGQTEYVRADLYARLQEQVETLRKERDDAREAAAFQESCWKQERDLKLEYLDLLKAAEAERDRLREALTRIADGGRGSISAAEKNHIAFAALQKEPQP